MCLGETVASGERNDNDDSNDDNDDNDDQTWLADDRTRPQQQQLRLVITSGILQRGSHHGLHGEVMMISNDDSDDGDDNDNITG